MQDGQGDHPDGRIPPLRIGEGGLLDDQGLLRGAQEESGHSAAVSPEADVPACHGGDQAQVHRHFIQVRARPLPDHLREAEVLRPPQGLSEKVGLFLVAFFLFNSRERERETRTGLGNFCFI